MNYIIVDLESTCWNNRQKKDNEIIEIGAVMIDNNANEISVFEQFIKPIINPTLSDFCTNLTSITQKQVDDAPNFVEALNTFQKWINQNGNNYYLCSWGYYDKSQFIKDCQLHKQDTAWLENHMSIKHKYAEIKNLKRAIGMKTALKKEKIKLEGFHHRGIDDAKNIAKIFIKYFELLKPLSK